MADGVENRSFFLKPAALVPNPAGLAQTRSARPSTPSAHAPALPRHENAPQPGAHKYEVNAGTMIVGPGSSLSGEITSCTRLIIEGNANTRLHTCGYVIIGESGVFRGDASTDTAEIHGFFEGDLIVRNRLLIRATGQVSGTITYGETEVERGGKISGAIQPYKGGPSVSNAVRARLG